MPSDFDKLDQKIRAAREGDKPTPKEIDKAKNDDNAKAGISAGFEFVGAIAVAIAIGYGLDSWLGTKPLFFILLFFLGIFTGFYNVYRVTQNLGTSVGFSRLHQQQKNANKTPELKTLGSGETEQDKE